MSVEIEIRSVDFAAEHCATRLPFRFGIVTLTQTPLLTARVSVAAQGATASGHAADLCIPKWFEKDPRKSVREDVRALFASARRAGQAFAGAAGTPFSIWWRAHRRCTEGDLAGGVRLVDGFGVALVERAMIDAVCRLLGISFRTAVAEGRLGFEPGALLEEAAGVAPRALVAPRPPSVLVRHTVGGLDPLRRGDVPPALERDDGHPVALEDDIARFGLSAFKLKAGGEPAQDVARLTEIVRVVDAAREHEAGDPLYTLDANESYADPAEVGRLLDRLEADPDGRRLLDGLAYLEQPLPRQRTLDPATRDAIRPLAERVPLLIDEADDRVDAFAEARSLGYRGVSVKNCKGVFRALANRALCVVHEGAPDAPFQTSEDLTNLPVLSLQQDLATVAALGLEHSERNGHHFFPGLDVVPPAEAERALARHPELYTRRGDRIVLDIRSGRLDLSCADAIGYGCDVEIDWAGRRPLDTIEGELGP